MIHSTSTAPQTSNRPPAQRVPPHQLRAYPQHTNRFDEPHATLVRRRSAALTIPPS